MNGNRTVLLGTARLPKEFLANNVGSLLLELAVDTEQRRIADVATNIDLPSYSALLTEILVGRRLDELDACAHKFAASYRGPLVKPTLAALRNAEANDGLAPAT
jgi:hypothetical protein